MSLLTPSSALSVCSWTTLSVEPASRSARLSPTQRIGLSWFLSAARTFLFTSSSVSPNRVLRSLCPRITWVAKSARSIGADISPVNAPDASKCMFCAPSLISEPSIAPATASSAVNGGQMTISTSGCAPADTTISRARETASADVLFIFQFPAMSFLRIMAVGSGFQVRDPGEDLALEVLQARAAASRAVRDLLRHIEYAGRRRGVAAADDRRRAMRGGLGDRVGHGPGRGREFLEFEDPRRAVPDDRLRAEDGRPVKGDRLRPGVEAHPALRDAGRVVRGPRGGVGGEPVGADVVDRQDDRDAAR